MDVSYIKEKLSTPRTQMYGRKYSEKVLNELFIFEQHFDRDYLLSNIEEIQNALSKDIKNLTNSRTMYKKLSIGCIFLFLPIVLTMKSSPEICILLGVINTIAMLYCFIQTETVYTTTLEEINDLCEKFKYTFKTTGSPITNIF